MRAHLLIVVGALVGCAGDVAHGPSTGSTLVEEPSTTSTTTMDTSGASASTSGTEEASTTEASTADAATTEPEVFDYEGEHVVVIAPDAKIELCRGTMAHMDDFVKRIAARLGVDPPVENDRIRFTWATSQEQLKAACDIEGDILGCANGDRITSLYVPHSHELVHSVSRRVGRPPSFFVEGLAVAHEGFTGLALPRRFYYNGTKVEIMELIMSSNAMIREYADGYEKAGRFAAYLIDRHGMDKYLELYAALPKNAGIQEIEQAFQDRLGLSLDESITGFASPWKDWHFDALLSECNAPEIPWDGFLLEQEAAAFCLHDNAIGPYDGNVVEEQYTIDIPVDGNYELRIVGDDQEATIIPDIDFTPFIGVSIVPCGIGKGGFMETRIHGTPRIGGLHAGRNSLRFLGIRSMPWPFKFTLRRLPTEDVIQVPP